MVKVKFQGRVIKEFPEGTSLEIIKNAVAPDIVNIMDYEFVQEKEGGNTVYVIKEKKKKAVGVNG